MAVPSHESVNQFWLALSNVVVENPAIGQKITAEMFVEPFIGSLTTAVENLSELLDYL